ncbi:QueT transporter family protein, partial [Bradyrhizobium sp. WBOS7]|nr:QueT transporter family protein [Bradyrhizobium sp. WBOS7]
MNNNNTVKRLVKTAIIAALYAVITLVLAPISYGPI